MTAASNGRIHISDPNADQVQSLRRLCRVRRTVVAVRPGWRRSPQAKLEVLVGAALGKRIVQWPEGRPVSPSVLDAVRSQGIPR
jgi:hypothetical protein